MARLHAVLGTGDLALPELCAARLDGEVFSLGTGWCPIDEPDLPSLRAAAVAPPNPALQIIERRTAAWVHGALPAPPPVPEYCVPYTARTTVRVDPSRVIRQVAIRADEVTAIGGIRCTTRLRTAFDLLRDVGADDHDVAVIVAALLRDADDLLPRLRKRVASAHRLPHKARALARLDLAGQPSLTR